MSCSLSNCNLIQALKRTHTTYKRDKKQIMNDGTVTLEVRGTYNTTDNNMSLPPQ